MKSKWWTKGTLGNRLSIWAVGEMIKCLKSTLKNDKIYIRMYLIIIFWYWDRSKFHKILKIIMKENPTLYHKALVAYLYFIQGVFLYVPGTTVLTYKTMPSYAILGFFSFATIPFSFKFISAPLIERYTNRSYGRRKTWVIISLLLASLFIILATKFTN